jgi:hypothetical protein
MQGQETTTSLKPTRASFIRGLPESMPVAEVIERGREAGLDINPTDVHSARYYMRQAAAPPPASRSTFAPASEEGPSVATPVKRDPAKESVGSPRPSGAQYMPPRTIQASVTAKPRAVPAPQAVAKARSKQALAPTKPTTKSLEEQLRLIVMRIGTDRARAIIEQVEELALRE